jgi:arylsulfatase A-like enzyme
MEFNLGFTMKKVIPSLHIALCGLFLTSEAFAADPKPNILLIIADDMGYSDITCFGGEVQTPHIDALAKSGIRATNFYVGPTCSPTRSMLLSGCDHHVAGFGNMDELAGPKQKGKPGYEGYLNDRVAPVAKVLREAGYHTYWAGKSHMGYEPSQWPAAMGFERDFTLLQGGGSNWSDMTYPNPAHGTDRPTEGNPLSPGLRTALSPLVRTNPENRFCCKVTPTTSPNPPSRP